MRRVLVAFVCIGLLVGAPATAVEAGAAQRRPALRLVDSAPLTIRGIDFVRGERVRIEIRIAGQTESRATRAGASGGFVVSFAGATFDHCTGLFAVAIGATGTRATLKLALPHCPVPLTAP